jgi:acetyltransferase-like isoleucine patch superfamily enzyme
MNTTTTTYQTGAWENLKLKFRKIKEEHPGESLAGICIRYVGKLADISVRMLTSRIYLRQCTVGSLVSTNGKPMIRNEGKIILGDRVAIWSIFDRTKLLVQKNGILTVGDFTRINGVHIAVKKSVTIGKRVRIGPYSLIMDSDFHDVSNTEMEGKTEPVTIGDDVWIASKVTILKGVTIGKGSMVAAGSVVTRNVPDYTLVAGVPAKPLKKLRHTTDREKLKSITPFSAEEKQSIFMTGR